MMSDSPIRVKMNELPKLMELIGPNGETKFVELLPSKNGLGVFVNKVSTQLIKYLGRSK